ncbi:hypothetical protein KIN20_034852 [Parelaphostrongylus tenuis]|uniref:Uncharacterized protein n=1 Tax=Parelaphostrongylus tenuis TaxID=148309 RepID=A0AAD5WJA4_PARTN|nr:hypothetical protein KIN20_034852 [Parelaphostrongylus tenuis]
MTGGDSKKMTVLVTGGTGLVGKAIEEIVNKEPHVDEKWVFIGSKDWRSLRSAIYEKIVRRYKADSCHPFGCNGRWFIP